jgi:hypothetical protein
MARKPKVLTRLRIDEISSVDRGAGEGVRVVLMKRHDRPPRNRFERMFRQVDFSKVKTNPLPQDPDNGDVDTDTKLSPQLEAHINAMLLVMPSLNRQQAAWFLLNTPHGRAMAEHLSSTTKRKEPPMNRADGLRQIAKDFGVAKLAKMVVMENDAHGISEHELSALAFEEAKKHALPGERPNSTFARWYSEPAQLELRKAIQISKNTPVSKSAAAPLMAFQPVSVEVGATNTASDAEEAYNQLTAMANAMRAKSPTLTAAGAFAAVFTDQANAALAAKAHRRPQASDAYAMP